MGSDFDNEESGVSGINVTGQFSMSSSSTTVMTFSSPVPLLFVQVAHPAMIL